MIAFHKSMFFFDVIRPVISRPGHAVGCEAGKLCKLVDTVLKGVQAPAGRNTETYDATMTSLVRWARGCFSLVLCWLCHRQGDGLLAGERRLGMGQGALSKPAVQWWLSLNSSMLPFPQPSCCCR